MVDFDREAWERDRATVRERMLIAWRHYERERYMRALDSLWKNHLYAMDHLKEGIHLEAYAQKDPKVLYKKEGFELFKQLLDLINTQVVTTLFRVEIQGEADVERLRRLRSQVAMTYGRGVMPAAPGASEAEQKAMAAQAEAASGGGSRTVVRQGEKVGRNDPCPCGSGKKYKKCHGAHITGIDA